MTLPLAAAVLLTACGVTPEERFERAQAAFEAHRYSEARLDLVTAIKDDPANVQALEMLARTHLALQDPVSAAAVLDRLAATGKLPADAHNLYAETDLMRGQFDKALERVAGDESAEAFRIRALAHVGREDLDAAAKAFAEGAQARGAKGRLLADYAHFRMAQDDLEGAAKLASKALAEKPEALQAIIVNADVAMARGRTADALRFYDRALAAYPESRAATIGRIGVLGETGRLDEVRTLVSGALERNPQDPDFTYFAALLASEDGDWGKVRKMLQPLEQTLEGRPAANMLYAKAMMELGHAEQARIRLSSLALREPGDRDVTRLLGEAKLKSGDASGALETLRPLAARPDAKPEELALVAKAAREAGAPEASNYSARAAFPTPELLASELSRGDAAIRAGNWHAAIAAYETILGATDGRNVLVLNNLAFAHSEAGDPAKALGYAEKALALAPDNPSVMDTAGWLLHRTGKDKPRGLALLRQAARKAPGNRTIAKHLAAAERG
ncbi:tetratricopeptide repeat protein [Novosphingobium marinum]|uniref:Tetratricopeptide (TPR) repeat protein n=1 Tax=Novosphingobium marinum TaxID=1514948 RepID=A0A7Y9XVL7_9SPHN|nr:tetratricopeptide repeat protein [Novosphingobium marinum]NYH94185.1 tetratricopeptide (TPR) repeat protein [Novosphingobium marinum]